MDGRFYFDLYSSEWDGSVSVKNLFYIGDIFTVPEEVQMAAGGEDRKSRFSNPLYEWDSR